MANPGYYVSDPLDVLQFPVAERFGSDPFGKMEGDVKLTTEKGKNWVYKKYSLRSPIVRVRVSATDLEFFRVLHETVGGQELPFYYTPDVDGMPDNVIFVRKEQNFDPVELGDPAVVDGEQMAMYDYALELMEEPTGAEVEA